MSSPELRQAYRDIDRLEQYIDDLKGENALLCEESDKLDKVEALVVRWRDGKQGKLVTLVNIEEVLEEQE